MVSPWAPPSEFETIVATELLGDLSASGAVTREIALRVPGLKRAHDIHCMLVSRIPFFQYAGDERAAVQPAWLTNSASGISPRHRMFGVTSDLFMNGWACLGFTADMSDALHVPVGMWEINSATGAVEINERIPAEYRARPVAIPLGYGANGVLVDGIDTIRAARQIERVWMDRINNPAPATDLHFTDPQYDGMNRKEQRKIVDAWNENRQRSGGQTAVTKSFIDVKALGQTSADLFEKGRNAIRLDLANQAWVPASIIEGAKDGGGTDINYSNEATSRNQLYDFGTDMFVSAIEARLSLDDVCPSGESIRGDATNLMAVPTPNMNPTSED